ncbi:MAG: OsmC family protein [Bacteroidota bacterium]|nr:OsmC family protein [Bacteroidota bacterium]MDP4204575.1 OsmC family protein [Bacteroidota bacterium]
MKHIIDLHWLKNLTFDTEVDGHHLQLDAAIEDGGNDTGPRPKKLLLVALAGCTAMDIISILSKMHVELDDFNVIVQGDLLEDHPKRYKKMHVIYQFKGKDLPYDKLGKAVKLSEEKYCGVRASFDGSIDLSSEIRVI